MQIQFQNDQQVALAELFWQCHTQDQVTEILNSYGRPAQVVYQMIMAEYLDQQTSDQTDFFQVRELLEDLK